MSRIHKALIIGLLALGLTTTGCIGQMGLSGKVREFNLETVDGRWEREILFVLLYVIPAYPFAGALDLIIFNSIEFWTGENPINGKPSVTPVSSRIMMDDDGNQVAMTLQADGAIAVEVHGVDGSVRRFTLERSEGGIVARDVDGRVIASSRQAGGLRPAAS